MAPDDVFKKAALVRLAVFDVDGVMTNGDLIFDEQGIEYKVFNVQDGFGLVMLREAGIKVAVISARTSSIVTRRMTELGVEHILQGKRNKQEAFSRLITDQGLDKSQTAFAGDDIIDLPAMSCAGMSIAVADAHPRVKEQADWVTTKSGGQGAVREICELVLESQGKLENIYQKFFDLSS